MIAMPAGDLDHRVQNRGLLRLGRLRPCLRLGRGDRLALGHRQLHPGSVPLRGHVEMLSLIHFSETT